MRQTQALAISPPRRESEWNRERESEWNRERESGTERGRESGTEREWNREWERKMSKSTYRNYGLSFCSFFHLNFHEDDLITPVFVSQAD